MSQDNYLFNETVRDNIRQGRPDATVAETFEVARKSGCYDFIMNLEDGLTPWSAVQVDICRAVRDRGYPSPGRC